MRYHVRARLGDELANRETEELDEALASAVELARRGFKVWVWGHEHVVEREGTLTQTRYRYDGETTEWEAVAEYEPGGRRVK